MARIHIDCGASDNSPVTVAHDDTIVFKNTNNQTINLVTPQGLDPKGAHKIDPKGTQACKVDAKSGTKDLIYTWQEVGALAPRNGRINVS